MQTCSGHGDATVRSLEEQEVYWCWLQNCHGEADGVQSSCISVDDMRPHDICVAAGNETA